jgi:hypothetical protein
MPKETAICYLSSLLFYGMGYSKMLDLNTEHYDFTMYDVSLATVYFVLTIFLAVIGSFFLYVNFRDKAGEGLNDRRRASIPEVKAQLSQSKYGMDLERRMSS